MCCKMKRGPMIEIAMMGMGMAMIAGMMMGNCMNDRMSNKKSMRRFGMMKKSDESDLQKA